VGGKGKGHSRKNGGKLTGDLTKSVGTGVRRKKQERFQEGRKGRVAERDLLRNREVGGEKKI